MNDEELLILFNAFKLWKGNTYKTLQITQQNDLAQKITLYYDGSDRKEFNFMRDAMNYIENDDTLEEWISNLDSIINSATKLRSSLL